MLAPLSGLALGVAFCAEGTRETHMGEGALACAGLGKGERGGYLSSRTALWARHVQDGKKQGRGKALDSVSRRGWGRAKGRKSA